MMARKSVLGSQGKIWLALFLALCAGIAASTWQSEVQTRHDRNWALKTSGGVISRSQLAEHEPPAYLTEESVAVTLIESNQDQPALPAEEPKTEPLPPLAPQKQPLLPPIAGIAAAESEKPLESAFEESLAIAKPARPQLTMPATAPAPTSSPKATEFAAAPAESVAPTKDAVIQTAPELPLESAVEAATPTGVFPKPRSLIADWESLQEGGPFAQLASAVLHELDILAGYDRFEGADLSASMRRLGMLREKGLQLAAAHSADPQLNTHLRAVHGLSRRLVVWGAVMAAEAKRHEPVSLSNIGIREVAQQVRADLRKSGNPAAKSWEQFLMLDEFVKPGQLAAVSERDFHLLHRLANRVHAKNLTEEQKTFLQSGLPGELVALVDLYLATPISSHALLEAIESYESEPTGTKALSIAAAIRQSSLMQGEQYSELADKLNHFYRAGNVRVAIAESLINRLIPEPERSNEPVNDELMGAQITGRSSVSTRLRVHLVPDQTRWRVGLEATGDVASNTQAFHGPFTFFNQGWANYRARTTVGLGKQGFAMNQPTAEATSQTDLLDLQSDFDGIPLFGLLARSVARQQHANKQLEAEWEVEGRMARRIEQKLDAELNTRMKQVEKEWSSRVAQPLEGLRLAPTPIAMETTSERLIARYRVAGDSQLAAHTPRPLAPSDSVMSVQLHVSAINNFIEQLQLSGKTYKLEDLYLHLSKATGATDLAIPDDMPAGVSVRFAEQDALRMDIHNGEAELTVRLAEIRQGRTKWKNVQVRGRFTPKVKGLHAELERTSYVELKGDGLKKIGGGQVILRMAFSSVLSRVSSVPLIHPKLTAHPQMQGFEIRQFALEDGWIGLAIGPKLATAKTTREERSETARKPRSPMLDSILRR